MQATLQEALALTQEVFREAEAKPALAGKDNILWALYGPFHRQVSIPLFLHRDKIAAGGGEESGLGLAVRFHRFTAGASEPMSDLPSKRNGFRSGISLLMAQLVPFLYSLASLLWLALRRRPLVAVWTGDFFDPTTRADFRIGNLNARLEERHLPFVELIRTGTTGVKTMLRNARLRRRPALYYDALVAYLGWLFPRARRYEGGGRMGLVQEMFAGELDRIAKTVPLFHLIFKAVGARELVAWEYSDRQAGLIHAARRARMPVIGFMHGAGMETYMAHEFMGEYRGDAPLGPDFFGVWSPWWKEYFESRSRAYGAVEVSGSLRKSGVPRRASVRTAEPLRKVLWISEPLAEVADIEPYLDSVSTRYELAIKKRPSTADTFYNRLLQARPDFRRLPVYDGNIFDAIAKCDVVIGSHSTAVIDAAVVGKPFVLVGTRKWGDYFEMGGDADAQLFFAATPAELRAAIERWQSADADAVLERVRRRFYGDPEADGCEWVVQKILRGRARDARAP